MNPKIKKLRGEVRKDKAKIAELQAHVNKSGNWRTLTLLAWCESRDLPRNSLPNFFAP